MLKVIPALVLVALMAATASADTLNNVIVTQVDNSAALSGYVTNDISIDFTGQYTQSQLLITLTQGSIYQDGFGGDTAPNAGFIGLVPSLAFDTFVTLGGATTATSVDTPSFAGGAINLGGQVSKTFNTSTIDAAWFVPGGTTIFDNNNFLSARVTLSDDAVGTWSYYGLGSFPAYTASGTVSGGQLIIPEPASLVLLAAGGLTFVVRGRRRTA